MSKSYKIPLLPLASDVETKPILKLAASAHRYLAELKGIAATIPNQKILITTLILQEAKDSSAVENIITTHDELFKAELYSNQPISTATKEVQNYAAALQTGFERVKQNKILSLAYILEIQQALEQNTAGLRKTLGTSLKNQSTGETVYTPPQHYDDIYQAMQNLVDFINDNTLSDLDPLVKMAMIHHQFESIHPFYDGNGRTGRIINILYLVIQDLLSLPILYLSGFVVRHKQDYYQLLQQVRDTGNWEDWILFNLKGVEQTAQQSIALVTQMNGLMLQYKHQIRLKLPTLYSQDLINHLFRHPYTKVDFLTTELQVSKSTALRYLTALVEHDFLEKYTIGKNTFYINKPLFELFKK
jgi:Fic family protein